METINGFTNICLLFLQIISQYYCYLQNHQIWLPYAACGSLHSPANSASTISYLFPLHTHKFEQIFMYLCVWYVCLLQFILLLRVLLLLVSFYCVVLLT